MIIIKEGYIIQFTHCVKVCHNIRTVIEDLKICRKTLYNSFDRGFIFYDDSLEGVYKIRKGVVVQQALNKNKLGEIKQKFKVIEDIECQY